MKEGRTTQVSIRLAADEREWIQKQADHAHLSEAAYIRKTVLGCIEPTVPKEVEVLLQKYLEENLSIGRDINHTARRCRDKGSFSAEQYKEVTECLENINANFEKLNELIREVIKRNGDHKTAPSEGEQSRKPRAASD